MNKFKLYLSVLLFLYCTNMTAQDAASSVNEELVKKKEINKIKMSEEAVYADIMEIASDDAEVVSSVHQKSRDMLQAHVIEVFAKRMKMNKKDVQEIWDVIDDKCQNIVIKKGDLFRVFSYIMKDAIGLNPKKPKEGDVEKYMDASTANEAPVAAQPVDSVSQVVTEVSDPIDSIPQTVADVPQELPISQPQPQETEIAVTPTPVVQPAAPVDPVEVPVTPTVQPVETPVEVPVTLTEQPVETPVEPVVTPTAPAIEVPDRVKTILGKSSMNEIILYLNAEKQSQTLVYGNMQTMQNPEKCYIIIIAKDTKNVVAILSRGSNNRINYVTGQPDDLNNYKGGKHSAIFVQEY